jgi:SAM-dependent methyltransferase
MMAPESLVITTAIRARPEEIRQARVLSASLGYPYVPRGRLNLDDLCRQWDAAGAVVVTRERLILRLAGKEFFFHPGLAQLRIRALRAGKTDQMVKAMGLRAGDRVLDCTLGLAADALVAAYVVGDSGRVVGLEAVPVVGTLVRYGLKRYRPGDAAVAAALRRVEVVVADHREYLPTLDGESFDVVYFDPMFRIPLRRSSSLEPLRPLAEHAPLEPGSVAEALRVARRRVVLKERRGSPEFDRLGFRRVVGGRYSPVAYGVIEKGGDQLA